LPCKRYCLQARLALHHAWRHLPSDTHQAPYTGALSIVGPRSAYGSNILAESAADLQMIRTLLGRGCRVCANGHGEGDTHTLLLDVAHEQALVLGLGQRSLRHGCRGCLITCRGNNQHSSRTPSGQHHCASPATSLDDLARCARGAGSQSEDFDQKPRQAVVVATWSAPCDDDLASGAVCKNEHRRC